MKVTESFTAVTVYCCVKSSRFWHCSNALALAGDTSTLAKPSTHKSKSLGRLGILPSFSLPLGWWFFDFLRPMSLGCNAKHCCNRQCMAMPSWSLVDDSMTMYDNVWHTWALSFLWAFFSLKSPAMQVYDAVIVWMTARWYQVRRKCFSRSFTWNLHMFNASTTPEVFHRCWKVVFQRLQRGNRILDVRWHDSDQKPVWLRVFALWHEVGIGTATALVKNKARHDQFI